MAKQEYPKLMTCSVHLFDLPWSVLKNDPTALHNNYEAIEKMHRFCHEIYNVPITWLCTWKALHEYQDRLVGYVREHGDEVAIMDGGIAAQAVFGNETEKYQSWVEECGLERPGANYRSKETEVGEGSRVLHDMTYEEQKTALSYLKSRYDQLLGQNTRTLAHAHTNGDSVKVMKEIGLDVSWGYCWDYFCEGINHKGSLLQPFYVSEVNHCIPEPDHESKRVLALGWGAFSPLIAVNVENHARMGMPGYCLNALELANRSEGHDKYRFHEKLIKEWMEQSKWNDFAYVPLQLEAVWMDESEMPDDLYVQYPRFNPLNTEVFFTEIETALRCGAKPLTLSGFADWHQENIGDTSPTIYYFEDLLPGLRSKGKDQDYEPMVIYGDSKHQFWFLKGRGMNYIRRYGYNPIVSENQVLEEYPFDMEPRVFLKVKSSVNMKTGISLTQDSACYEVAGFHLSAYDDYPDYAAVLWEANTPSYVTDAQIETGGALIGFRTIREKNLAIVFADLKRGNENELVFRSDIPNDYIRIKSVEKVGSRFEIWIQNDSDEVLLHTLKANLEPGLKIGGFWWDGFYSHTIYRYGSGWYDRASGEFEMQCFYPIALKVNKGLTRISVELL